MDDFEKIEKEIKEKELEKKKKIHRVSGKSVFKLQQIILDKAKKEEVREDHEEHHE